MKKMLSLLLALVMVLSLAACGASNPPATEAPKADDAKTDAPATEAPKAEDAKTEYKVAMITDYGDITDQSFNQTTWEAVVAFGKDNGVETKYYKPTTNTTADRVASTELAIAEGYNVIVMPGYAFGATVAEIS